MSYYADDTVTVHHGDCLDILATLPDASVDAVCTDPPYGISFMGKRWDQPGKYGSTRRGGSDRAFTSGPVGVDHRTTTERSASMHAGEYDLSLSANQSFGAWCLLWAVECLRVLKPGGHLLAFGGTRTSHRLACAIEDAGFEIRDSICWLYGSGFPKSLDVSKAIDKAAGAEREVIGPNRYDARRSGTDLGVMNDDGWTPGPRVDTAPASDAARTWQGWGTALKPAHEPVVVARKPLAGTVAGNVQAHGTGGLNIDGCRVGDAPITQHGRKSQTGSSYVLSAEDPGRAMAARWPANVVLDESQAAALDQQSGEQRDGTVVSERRFAGWEKSGDLEHSGSTYGGAGGASRFFYTAKADAAERVRIDGTAHPTVKPLALMRWLVRLVTPPGGLVLEPFAGSGTTVEACILEGFRCVAIEREADYLPLIVQRIHRRRDPVAAVLATAEDGGLFDLLREEDDGPVKPAGGRWPPNVVMDKSQAAELDKQSGELPTQKSRAEPDKPYGEPHVFAYGNNRHGPEYLGDTGGASRFFPVFDADDAGEEEPA